MGIPNSWMVYFMENHIKLDDLGIPQLKHSRYLGPISIYNYFPHISEMNPKYLGCYIPISGNLHICMYIYMCTYIYIYDISTVNHIKCCQNSTPHSKAR